jgi:hypothetical protein
MNEESFHDAFLDSEYLKLDEGALGFIFTQQRLERALECGDDDVRAMINARRPELVSLVAETAGRILREAFYTRLFEELSELPDELAIPFIHLALRRVTDPEIEAARAQVVREYQARRKPGPK